MNLYKVTFTRQDTGIKSEEILATDEPQARAIFADCEVLSVELTQKDYDQELESQKNAAKIWAAEQERRNMTAAWDYIEQIRQEAEIAADTEWLGSLAYGDADLTKLPPANGIKTLQELADAKDRSFNSRYYNNPNGEPKFVYGGGRDA